MNDSIYEQRSPEELNEEDRKYLYGKHNWLIRMYFYLEQGLNILNEFRNWFLGIAALYITLKLENAPYGILIIGAIAVPSLLVLILAGRYNVHRLSKMKEWLTLRFSTHYGIRTYNHQEMQTKLLLEIRDLLIEQKKRW